MSTSNSLTAGSYWKEKATGVIVKVIVPDAYDHNFMRMRGDKAQIVVFRTYAGDIEVSYRWKYCFLDEFEEAIWREGEFK